MWSLRKLFASLIAIIISLSFTFFGINIAQAEEIDVSYLQTCLKEEGSSLDVLVLMDASASLRNSRPGDSWHPKKGSDPDRKRGKILKSSLKLLQTLASESQRPLNLNVRTFGKNSDPKELKNLEEHAVDWTDASKGDLENIIEKALYDESTQTEWASGLASAKDQFKQRLGKAALEGNKSCPIMFWITDGAPTDSTVPICTSNTNSSIDWFRENNVLVLGGLLQPRDEQDRAKASQFRPIVTGENCGNFQPGWTRGEVIEAKDIGDLAWGFVGLVASIKNLINLHGDSSSFFVDPGSSHIEIFIRGNKQSWSVKGPDGAVACSSEKINDRCKVSYDSEIGIVTVTIFPENPAKSAGNWTISPAIMNENFQVYGSLNTTSREAQKTQPRLMITPAISGGEIEEGKSAQFNARIINPDGSSFSIDGFKNVSICAKVASTENQSCKSGTNSADLNVTPVMSDKSVAFEAILTSSHDQERNYRIAASQSINVIPSGIFPSLGCSKNPCRFENLKNKSDKSVNVLQVLPAENGNGDGKISLVSFKVLSDENIKRGDGHFNFQAQKIDGEMLSWPSKDQYLVPGDKFNLTVSTDMAGDSEINGILKYKVYSGDQEITRQLGFKLNVGNETNKLVQIGLLLLAYLVTLGIPYAYLLWSARKAAVLNVLYGEIGYVVLPFEIGADGKIREKAESIENTFYPDYTKLNTQVVEPNSRSVKLDNILIEVLPPKWNPFADTKTVARIPQNYLFSSYGKHGISFEEISFNSSLLDEAIFYFPGSGNIVASNSTSQEIVEDDSGLGFLDSGYEMKLKEVIESPTGAVRGNVVFMVSPYVTPDNHNKEKSLSELVEKLKPILSNFEFAQSISALREQSLKALKDKLEAEKLKNTKTNEVKDPKTSESPISNFNDDEWGGYSSGSTRKIDLPDSPKNDDSW